MRRTFPKKTLSQWMLKALMVAIPCRIESCLEQSIKRPEDFGAFLFSPSNRIRFHQAD